METFFSGMQNQAVSNFAGRIVNTPMGPFRWNDGMELWENVNNGMVLNNISLNDLMMIGYDNLGGDAHIQQEQYTTGNIGVLTNTNNTDLTTPDTDFWAAPNAAVTNVANAGILTFIKAAAIELERFDEIIAPPQMFYSKNGGAKTLYLSGFTMGIGDTLKVGIRTSIPGDGNALGSIRIFVTTPNFTVANIPYKFNV